MLEPSGHGIARAAQDLSESQIPLASIVASVTDAIITIDEAQRITLFNPAAEIMFGYAAKVVLDQSVDMLLPERYQLEHRERIRLFGETGVSSQSMGGLTVLWGVRANGEEFAIEATISQVEAGAGKLYTLIVRDITERKRTEEQMKESVALMQATMDCTDEGIIVLDDDGQVLTFNRRTLELWGLDAENLNAVQRRQLLESLTIAKDPQAIYGVYLKSKQNPERSRTDTIEFLDGRVLERYSQPYHLNGSNIGKLWGFRDVTERALAALELRESKARYQRIVEASPEGIWVVDQDEMTTYVNPRMAEMLGSTVGAIQGSPLSAFMFAEDYALVQSQIGEQRSIGVTHQVDVRFMRSDGTALYCMVSTNGIQDDDGKYLGSIAMCADVAERRANEEALRESQQFLEESQEMAGMGNWSMEIATGKLSWSRETYKIFGLDPNAGEILFSDFAKLVHPEDLPTVEEELNATIETGVPFESDYRVIWPDDSLHWVHGRGQVLRDENGVALRVRGLAHDITLRIESEVEHSRMEGQLRQGQKMEAIGTLAGGIAHDFNNILSAIQGYGELVQETLDPTSDAWQDQQEVLMAATRAAGLVRQILTFSRKAETKRGPVPLGIIIKEIVKLMKATLPSTIEVRASIEVQDATVNADPVELHQVLLNLCSNAGQAMMETGGRLEINLREFEYEESALQRVAGLKPGSHYLISVSDNGTGILPEHIERIFEPFFTTKEVGAGTGLGLSIVHGVAADLGGAVSVYSEMGAGTSFHVYIPQATTSVAPVNVGAPQRGTESVLFVDDELQLVRLGQKGLEQLGYSVMSCNSSLDALARFEAAPNFFDIVITDETMPKLRGTQLAERIVAIRPDIPIILCTGYSLKLEGAGLPLGIHAVLLKPVTRTELTKTIRTILDDKIKLERGLAVPLHDPNGNLIKQNRRASDRSKWMAEAAGPSGAEALISEVAGE